MATHPKAAEIIAMAREDLRLRTDLAGTGALFDGYHPDMERLHNDNARQLDLVITGLGGWPSSAMVGEEAAEAAWLIVQHAISLPDFQRRMLTLVKAAAAAGDVPAWHAACLEDRIRVLEGRTQIYGSQFDWDDAGVLSPAPIEDPQNVNARRAAIGLNAIEEKTEEIRSRARAEGEAAPENLAQRRKEAEDWARKAGWRP
jgi:hypothetical protein